MRSTLIRWILPMALATTTIAGSFETASAQPADRRRAPPSPAPNAAPPAPRAERDGAPRRGFVWVSGAWDWRNGQWVWVAGHYERSRAGKRFRSLRWDQRDGAWVRVEGSWEDAPASPDRAPPDPRDERPRMRRGFIWVKGHWDWQDGNWQWTAGHFERERAGARWREGRWDQRDGRWQWNEGGWQEGETTRSDWRFDSRGWTMLGEKTVDGRTDSDQVDFSQKQGKVSKITIVVLDSDLEMIDLKVLYVSGKDLHPTDKHYFREDSRTRVINLDPNEILRAVIFKYRNLPGGGRARVQVWGNLK